MTIDAAHLLAHTYTKGANEKLAGGGYTPTASVGANDRLLQRWDASGAWVAVVGRPMTVGKPTLRLRMLCASEVVLFIPLEQLDTLLV